MKSRLIRRVLYTLLALILVGCGLMLIPRAYLEASPIRYVDKNVPPTMTIHGTSDELVPNSQADQLNQRLDGAGIPHVDERYPLWPHAMILVQRVYDHCTPEMNEFFEKYLNKQYGTSTTKK